jgi:hypothetical protein
MATSSAWRAISSPALEQFLEVFPLAERAEAEIGVSSFLSRRKKMN